MYIEPFSPSAGMDTHAKDHPASTHDCRFLSRVAGKSLHTTCAADPDLTVQYMYCLWCGLVLFLLALISCSVCVCFLGQERVFFSFVGFGLCHGWLPVYVLLASLLAFFLALLGALRPPHL